MHIEGPLDIRKLISLVHGSNPQHAYSILLAKFDGSKGVNVDIVIEFEFEYT